MESIMSRQDYIFLATQLQPKDLLRKFAESLFEDKDIKQFRPLPHKARYQLLEGSLMVEAYEIPVDSKDDVEDMFEITPTVEIQLGFRGGVEQWIEHLYIKCLVDWLKSTQDDLVFEADYSFQLVRRNNVIYVDTSRGYWDKQKLALLPDGYKIHDFEDYLPDIDEKGKNKKSSTPQ